jgi:arsenate reductase
MAEAFYERRGGEARSAGSLPEREIHPQVAEAMDEVGVSLEGRHPTGITDEDVEWADLVVTMGCGDACPVLPGKRYLEWELADPAGMPIEQTRALRDEIARLVDALPPI